MNVPVIADDPLHLPTYARPGDAGADLRCTSTITLAPGQRVLAGTGVRVALPHGTVGLVTPRSGLAARRGLGIVNSPGIIDSGYRGEILVCLINHDPQETIVLEVGDRIAQLVVMPYIHAHFEPTVTLDDTDRGSGGYGSTGVNQHA